VYIVCNNTASGKIGRGWASGKSYEHKVLVGCSLKRTIERELQQRERKDNARFTSGGINTCRGPLTFMRGR
jgi:hypothetical protein